MYFSNKLIGSFEDNESSKEYGQPKTGTNEENPLNLLLDVQGNRKLSRNIQTINKSWNLQNVYTNYFE